MAQRRQITEDDKIALEDHSYVTTNPERIQNTKHRVLRLNQDGAQPLNQRPDLAQAKRECKRMHDELVKKIQQEYRPILRDQQSRQRRGQAFEGIDEHDYRVDPRTDWQSHRETCRIRPRPQIGTVTIGRREVGIIGILRGLTIRDFFCEFRTNFGCRERNFQIIDGVCEQNTHSYSMHRCAQCVSPSRCTV